MGGVIEFLKKKKKSNCPGLDMEYKRNRRVEGDTTGHN